MLTLQYPEPFKAEIIDEPTPTPPVDQALAKTIVSNVSAGTEMAFYRGTAAQINHTVDSHGIWRECEDALTYPMSTNDPGCWWMGYACVSEIINVGSEFSGAKVGDIIFTAKGHQQYHLVNDGEFLSVPAGMPPEEASFKTLMEIAYNGFLDANIKLLDKVVIFGMGTIGQLLLQICKLAGATTVAVDFLDNRLELARNNGADIIVNPMHYQSSIAEAVIRALGEKADAVIEVSGNSKALYNAVACAKNDTQVTVLSFYQEPPSNFYMGQEFHHNRVIIRSSQIGGIQPGLRHQMNKNDRAIKAMNLISKINVNDLISHRCAFINYPEIIKLIDKNPADTLAVVIKYEGE